MQRIRVLLAAPQHASAHRIVATIGPRDRRRKIVAYHSRRKYSIYRRICELFRVIIVQNQACSSCGYWTCCCGNTASRAQHPSSMSRSRRSAKRSRNCADTSMIRYWCGLDVAWSPRRGLVNFRFRSGPCLTARPCCAATALRSRHVPRIELSIFAWSMPAC